MLTLILLKWKKGDTYIYILYIYNYIYIYVYIVFRKKTDARLRLGSEFYNRPMKKYLSKTGIEVFSTRNEGKIIAERFTKTL